MGGGSERLARSDPARGQFRAQLVARFFKMGGRDSNGATTDTSDVVTKRAVREWLEGDCAQKRSIKREVRCQRLLHVAPLKDRSARWVARREKVTEWSPSFPTVAFG